eukprot:Gb_30687 [translate_table: standard]
MLGTTLVKRSSESIQTNGTVDGSPCFTLPTHPNSLLFDVVDANPSTDAHRCLFTHDRRPHPASKIMNRSHRSDLALLIVILTWLRSCYLYLACSQTFRKAISSGLNEVRYVVFAPLGHAAGQRIGVYLLQHMLYLDLSFHLERSSGVLLRILERAQRSVVHVFRAVGMLA